MKVHKSQRVVVKEKRYPGVGLLLTFGTGLLFWSTLAYVIFN